MQPVIFIFHLLSCILAFFIFKNNKTWKYYAFMLFFVNLVGAIFYVVVLFFSINSTNHPLSQTRALLQVLAWFIFSLSLYRGNRNNGT